MRLKSYLFFIILLCGAICAKAQPDSLQANKYHLMGDSLISNGQYGNAIQPFEKGNEIFEQLGDWESHLYGLNKIAEMYLRTGQLPRTDSLLTVIEQQSAEKLPDGHANYAYLFTTRGYLKFYSGKFREALSYHLKALEVRKVHFKDHSDLGLSYYWAGNCHNVLGEYDHSERYYRKTLDLWVRLLGEEHPRTAAAYSATSALYLAKRNYHKALETLEKTKNIYLKTLHENHPQLAPLFSNMGIAYFEMGQFDRALEYYQKSVRLDNIRTGGVPGPDQARTLNNIGNTYRAMGNSERASTYHQQALEIFEAQPNSGGFDVAGSLKSLGIDQIDNQAYATALRYFKRSLELFLEELEPTHPTVLDLYILIGASYLEMGKEDQGLSNYRTALKFAQDSSATQVKHTHEVFDRLGLYFTDKKMFDSAIYYQEKAMITLDPNSNNLALDIFDQAILLKALFHQSQTLHLSFLHSGSIKHAEASLSSYQKSDSILENIQFEQLRIQDQITLSKTAHEMYQGATKLIFDIQNTTPGQYQDQLFYFITKSKSIVLSQTLRSRNLRKFRGLSDETLELEQYLKENQSFYRSQLEALRGQGVADSSSQYIALKERIFINNRSLDSLNDVLKDNYPQYFQLKYNNDVIDVSTIQKELAPDEALIEYFEADTTIYVFAITREGTFLDQVKRNAIYEDHIKKWQESFDFNVIQNNAGLAFNEYAKSATYLYRVLLHPTLNQLKPGVNKLILIPDGAMASLPWELLITEDPDEAMDYGELAYLIKEYTISYAYSATLLFQELYRANKQPSETMLAFAPSYPLQFDSTSYTSIKSNFRGALTPLKWNKREVETISENINGNYYSAREATESQFKKEAGNHRLLHLSMHALIDHEDPMLSKLVFSPAEDSLEDGMLHTYELYNMDLPAEMVVLSACETGIGELSRGEGVMSLGRAFSYAGCPSVVMSHWSVDDESTAQLMTSFYEYIADGQSKATALRKAKLDFLESAVGPKKHPFYWGGFVIMGNTDPIQQRSNWMYWAFFLIAAGGIIFVARKR